MKAMATMMGGKKKEMTDTWDQMNMNARRRAAAKRILFRLLVRVPGHFRVLRANIPWQSFSQIGMEPLP
jgi:hypothetical protein